MANKEDFEDLEDYKAPAYGNHNWTAGCAGTHRIIETRTNALLLLRRRITARVSRVLMKT
jgi:hypothetical protein